MKQITLYAKGSICGVDLSPIKQVVVDGEEVGEYYYLTSFVRAMLGVSFKRVAKLRVKLYDSTRKPPKGWRHITVRLIGDSYRIGDETWGGFCARDFRRAFGIKRDHKERTLAWKRVKQ